MGECKNLPPNGGEAARSRNLFLAGARPIEYNIIIPLLVMVNDPNVGGREAPDDRSTIIERQPDAAICLESIGRKGARSP